MAHMRVSRNLVYLGIATLTRVSLDARMQCDVYKVHVRHISFSLPSALLIVSPFICARFRSKFRGVESNLRIALSCTEIIQYRPSIYSLGVSRRVREMQIHELEKYRMYVHVLMSGGDAGNVQSAQEKMSICCREKR